MRKGLRKGLMITEKLYDDNSFLAEFTAKVVSSNKDGEFYKTILDKTCFFPQAAGQLCDRGFLNGFAVNDVKIENGEIVHYLREYIREGDEVAGKIDFERRFSFMQNHTGEHIVSGIVNRLFGFNNVGFHLNEELVTLDFDGILSKQDLKNIEYLANKVVWENRTVKAYYPEKKELINISFRQKSEIEGDTRLVEIEGTDICACCAPHVKTTGQIGLIKFLSTEKMRGGIRIYMKCGEYALKDYFDKSEQFTAIQNLLSLKPNEIASGVSALKSRLDEQKRENANLKQKLLKYISEEIKDTVALVENFDMPELQRLCDMLYKKNGVTHTVFCEIESGKFNLVICGKEEDVNRIFEQAKQNIEIKGGGRNGMRSAIVVANPAVIIKEFSK